jgi:hypothetical protein
MTLPRYESHNERLRALEDEVKALNARLSARTGFLLRGAGAPDGEISAPVGTLYLQSDADASPVLWVKESGTGDTGWVAK